MPSELDFSKKVPHPNVQCTQQHVTHINILCLFIIFVTVYVSLEVRMWIRIRNLNIQMYRIRIQLKKNHQKVYVWTVS